MVRGEAVTPLARPAKKVKKAIDNLNNLCYNKDKIERGNERRPAMTKREMLKEMFEKGYTSQYPIEWFEESFTIEQIKIFYDNFMEYLRKA